MFNYTFMSNYTFWCIRLQIFKSCLCCFLDVPLYSNNLPTLAMISSSNILELLSACFSCSSFFMSQISSASDG